MTEPSMGTLRTDGNRRGVRFERRFDAPPERVWAALTEPAHLSAWIAEARFEASVGGTLELDFGDGGVCRGTVLVFDPPRVLEYEWRFPGEDESILRFELSPDGDGTLLVLDHRRLGADQATGYGAGWHAHLDVLDSYLRGETLSWDERFAATLPTYRRQGQALEV